MQEVIALQATGDGAQVDLLDETATTIMLTRLPRKLTAQMLLQNLSTLVDRRGYDYVQLPPASPPAANTGLAFINFTSPDIAQRCFQALKAMQFYAGRRYLGTCRPLQAHVQGFGENLIWFVVSCGLGALEDRRAPLVFENGVRVANIRSSLDRHVTWEMTHRAHLQAQELKARSALQRAVEYDEQEVPHSEPCNQSTVQGNEGYCSAHSARSSSSLPREPSAQLYQVQPCVESAISLSMPTRRVAPTHAELLEQIQMQPYLVFDV